MMEFDGSLMLLHLLLLDMSTKLLLLIVQTGFTLGHHRALVRNHEEVLVA